MGQHNFRRRPISEAILEEMDLQTSFNVYRDRFADASDFSFVFVGAFKLPALEPLVKAYLGALPSLRRDETWRDLHITPPKGVIDKMVKKGIEPKSSVRMMFTGPFSWSSKERYAMNSLASVLWIKLREVLREEKGGTYGVSVSGTPTRYPRPEYRMTISFGCAPERVEELTKTTLEQVDSVKYFGTTADYVNKVKEIQRRERETNLKENRFWLNALSYYYSNEEDPKQLLEYDTLIDNLSSETVRAAANKYFDLRNYARFVLSPR
jgi:zinc protease